MSDSLRPNPTDCSLPGSSVHGIFQPRILEWVAISFSRGSPQSRYRTRVSCIVGRRFTVWATREGGGRYFKAKLAGGLCGSWEALKHEGVQIWIQALWVKNTGSALTFYLAPTDSIFYFLKAQVWNSSLFALQNFCWVSWLLILLLKSPNTLCNPLS